LGRERGPLGRGGETRECNGSEYDQSALYTFTKMTVKLITLYN
jgi:hypothetical protein